MHVKNRSPPRNQSMILYYGAVPWFLFSLYVLLLITYHFRCERSVAESQMAPYTLLSALLFWPEPCGPWSKAVHERCFSIDVTPAFWVLSTSDILRIVFSSSRVIIGTWKETCLQPLNNPNSCFVRRCLTWRKCTINRELEWHLKCTQSVPHLRWRPSQAAGWACVVWWPRAWPVGRGSWAGKRLQWGHTLSLSHWPPPLDSTLEWRCPGTHTSPSLRTRVQI